MRREGDCRKGGTQADTNVKPPGGRLEKDPEGHHTSKFGKGVYWATRGAQKINGEGLPKRSKKQGTPGTQNCKDTRATKENEEERGGGGWEKSVDNPALTKQGT